MIDSYFSGICRSEFAMHAEPIAVLAALKLASLALHSTHSYGYDQFLLKRGSRAARAKLDSTHHSRSL
jgi:hypothetical protein